MSVYVDTPITYAGEPAGYIGRPRARARWCHMIADTLDELHVMAARVGLRASWFQRGRAEHAESCPLAIYGPPACCGCTPTYPKAHYDLVPTRREQAIARGAIALDRRAFVAKLRAIRATPTKGAE